MLTLGAHMSMAGGFEKAVEEANRCQCDCVQFFTKNNNQWQARPITEEQIHKFREALVRHGIRDPIAHSSYLINLASPDRALWKKSIDALIVELQRAEQLDLSYVVVHPGSYTTSSEAAGLKRVVRAFNEINRQTSQLRAHCLVETTAGQGSSLGWRFEHIANILDHVNNPDRLGVCLDTCHVFAAGYPLSSETEYRRTMRSFQQSIGRGKLKAIHLNDSKRELGSRVDRHEHIGEGKLGLEAFRNLLNDQRLRGIPMYLETPKGMRGKIPWDIVNVRRLRKLLA